MQRLASHLLAGAALVFATAAAVPASAALFEDQDARRAILDLRQRLDLQRQVLEAQLEAQREIQRQSEARLTGELRRASEDNEALRRSVLDLLTQIDSLRAELARLRGQDEQMARDIAELQRRQKDVAQGVETRLRSIEPVKVVLDGVEFSAQPNEQRDYETALTQLRASEFAAAQTAFTEFLRRYPQSGYGPSARFWLGNAQYATRDYRGAIASFRAMLAQAPEHPRAADATLSIANCQIELKDTAAARKTLTELVKDYPQSEAAATARQRLPRLR